MSDQESGAPQMKKQVILCILMMAILLGWAGTHCQDTDKPAIRAAYPITLYGFFKLDAVYDADKMKLWIWILRWQSFGARRAAKDSRNVQTTAAARPPPSTSEFHSSTNCPRTGPTKPILCQNRAMNLVFVLAKCAAKGASKHNQNLAKSAGTPPPPGRS